MILNALLIETPHFVMERKMLLGIKRRAERAFVRRWREPRGEVDGRLVGAAGLGIANGVARDLLYKDRVGDLAAHQISTGTLIAALAGYSRALERRWPIPTTRSAQTIGGIWLSLTVLFEFIFGHYGVDCVIERIGVSILVP